MKRYTITLRNNMGFLTSITDEFESINSAYLFAVDFMKAHKFQGIESVDLVTEKKFVKLSEM